MASLSIALAFLSKINAIIFVPACALAGFVRAVVGKEFDRRLAGALTSLLLFAFVSTVHLNLTFSMAQGRYLFPALSALIA